MYEEFSNRYPEPAALVEADVSQLSQSLEPLGLTFRVSVLQQIALALVKQQEELLSNLVYGRPESSGFPAHLSLVNPIDELHVGNHAGQMTEAA